MLLRKTFSNRWGLVVGLIVIMSSITTELKLGLTLVSCSPLSNMKKFRCYGIAKYSFLNNFFNTFFKTFLLSFLMTFLKTVEDC